jgi:hypothetical protein
MNSTTPSGPGSLTWRQAGKLESQLVSGGEVVGTLRWTKGWGTPATGESTEGSWTFSRAGLLTPKILARTPGSKMSSATMTMKWRGGGVIDLPTGRSFHFTPKGFWRSEWSLTDPAQKRLLTIRPNFGGTVGASVDVEPTAQSVRELPLMAILCWYAVLLLSHDSGDDGAIAASLMATGTI